MIPRWVEAHGIATTRRTGARSSGAGYALGPRCGEADRLVGDADARAVAPLARESSRSTRSLEREDAGAARRGRRRARDPSHAAGPGCAARSRGRDAAAGGRAAARLPLADELRGRARAATVWARRSTASRSRFAYAPWRSADVVRRQRRHAARLPPARARHRSSPSAMIRDERARGREPVWGADEDNHASLRLAARLGFVAVDEIWVCAP